MNRRLFALALALVVGMIVGLVAGMPLRASRRSGNVSQDLDELVRAIDAHQISRVEILHVRDDILTRTTITPEALRRMCITRMVLDRPWESSTGSLSSAIRDLRTSTRRDAGDLRWAALFLDSKGKEVSAVFLGRDGSAGEFEGAPLDSHGNLLKWMKSSIEFAFDLKRSTTRNNGAGADR